MPTTPALFLIADDDTDYARFVGGQIDGSPLHWWVRAESAPETILYLESLFSHHPTGTAVPCVLLIGFAEQGRRAESVELDHDPSRRATANHRGHDVADDKGGTAAFRRPRRGRSLLALPARE